MELSRRKIIVPLTMARKSTIVFSELNQYNLGHINLIHLAMKLNQNLMHHSLLYPCLPQSLPGSVPEKAGAKN